MKRTILIIDDERDVINALLRQLRKEPIIILSASSTEEAFTILKENKVHLVIADHRMPSTTGVEFLRRVKKQWPDIVRFIISGYIETALLISAINEGEVYRFITKPWDGKKLKEYIYDGLQHYDVLESNRDVMNELLKYNECLDAQVTDRNRALNLSNSIFEELPFGIIAIDEDNKILRTNTYINDLFNIKNKDQNGIVRETIDFLFPPCITDFIENGLSKNDGQAAKKFELKNKAVTVHVRRLRKDIDTAKGLIIIHE